ncbi:hypothetical protein WHI96_13130 [Pseudonocardia tropica]|uniref:Uncharacterized protein n=1 Tax=Pseudonocardia tropica TaxID=681289 RepID=A0ABV1JUZ8_9PSEU
MNRAGWSRTEVGSFPLLVEPDRTVTVAVLSPGAVRIMTLDGEEVSPRAALIEVVTDLSAEPIYIYPPDVVRLATLLVDALPIADLHDGGAGVPASVQASGQAHIHGL